MTKQEAIQDYTVKCNKCGWTGHDENLALLEGHEVNGEDVVTAVEYEGGKSERLAPRPKHPEFWKGCPICKDDAHLMDSEAFEPQSTATPSPVKEGGEVIEGFTSGEVDNNLHDGNVYAGGIVIANCYSSLISPQTIKANAANIVRCWNGYPALLEENKQLRAQVETLRGALGKVKDEVPFDDDSIWYDNSHCHQMRNLKSEITTALSQTEPNKEP